MLKKYFLIQFLLILLTCSCSRVPTLNASLHEYSLLKEKIIWLQVAGVSEDFLSIYKYNEPVKTELSWINSLNCTGKAWRHNLYEMRPSSKDSTISQLFGTKNVKNYCQNRDELIHWNKFREDQNKIFVLENKVPDSESFESLISCLGFPKWKVWKMSSKIGGEPKEFFHYTDKVEDDEFLNTVVYDKSCQNNECASTLLENYKYISQNFSTDIKPGLLLIRDYSLISLIQERNNRLIREKLSEIAEIIKHATKYSNTLLLVTGVRPYTVELPVTQLEWTEYFNNFKSIKFKENALFTSVWAQGPSAENFCGLMDESEILFRLNFVPPARKINLDLFKNLFR